MNNQVKVVKMVPILHILNEYECTERIASIQDRSWVEWVPLEDKETNEQQT
jgi:hypothetical protein